MLGHCFQAGTLGYKFVQRGVELEELQNGGSAFVALKVAGSTASGLEQTHFSKIVVAKQAQLNGGWNVRCFA